MLEPSNPRPSRKLSSSSWPSGRLKCCQVPGRSMKRTSTTSTPSALARSITSRGLVLLPNFVSIAIYTLLNPGFDELTFIVEITGARYHGLPPRIGRHLSRVDDTTGDIHRVRSLVRSTHGSACWFVTTARFVGAPACPSLGPEPSCRRHALGGEVLVSVHARCQSARRRYGSRQPASAVVVETQAGACDRRRHRPSCGAAAHRCSGRRSDGHSSGRRGGRHDLG